MGLGLNTKTKTWYNFDKEPISIKKKGNKPDATIFKFKFVLSPHRQIYKRSIYTLLDWLGDIGGLLDAL